MRDPSRFLEGFFFANDDPLIQTIQGKLLPLPHSNRQQNLLHRLVKKIPLPTCGIRNTYKTMIFNPKAFY